MPTKQMPRYVTSTKIASDMDVSIQAVSQFLKRKGVKPVHGGGGPCTHFYDPAEVEKAYRSRRWYNHGQGWRNV